MHVHGTEFRVQEIRVDKTSHFAGKLMKDLALQTKTGVTIIAVVRGSVNTANPTPKFRIEANAILILLGLSQHLSTFQTFTDRELKS
ncbi:MAG: cation:proton antiporter regulatory subunit [Trueperaceae bacterium]